MFPSNSPFPLWQVLLLSTFYFQAEAYPVVLGIIMITDPLVSVDRTRAAPCAGPWSDAVHNHVDWVPRFVCNIDPRRRPQDEGGSGAHP